MFALLLLISLIVLVVVATILTEVEQFGWATITLIACLVGAHFFHVGGFNLVHFVEAHTLQVVLYSIGYVVIGVIWSFIKWLSYLMSYRDKFREHKEAFLKTLELEPGSSIPEDKLEAFKHYLTHNVTSWGSHREIRWLERPRASKNKSRIVAWMSLWPCSVIGTVLNDPVRRLFNFLFNWFKALYQQMADRVFVKDVELK